MRTRLTRENCSVARSLDILSDPWTLLIVRDAFTGTRRFADFERRLPVSKNILTARLKRLVEENILETKDAGQYGRRLEYHLTPKGKDLLTVVTALREWGDRWIFGEGHEPLVVLDRRTGERVPPLRIRDGDGQPIEGRDLLVAPGPGASLRLLEEYERSSSSRTRVPPEESGDAS